MPERPPRSLVKALARIVGREHVFSSEAARHVYSYDASLETAEPAVVVLPTTAEQVAAVVRLAVRYRLPLVPRGAGTNLSGGSVPWRGGLVIGLARLNRVLAIDEANGLAVVEPGVVNQHLQDLLGRRGFYFAPDPASQKVATLGGHVGENSGGPHCLKYGVTANHVLGVQMVTPDGRLVELGGPAGRSIGYDLTGIVVGAEGTLGIVTRITVRILRRPEATKTLLAIYDDLDDAADTVSHIIAAGILPATLEMMDQPIIRAIEASLQAGYPLDAEAVLIIELDGPSDGLEEQAEEVIALCREHRVRQVTTARTPAERERLWAGRRGAFGAIARIAPNYLVMDGTVPRTALTAVLRQSRAVAERYGLKSGNVFHAGDGNLHPLLFFDARQSGAEARVRQAGHEILQICLQAGGTITGEHGVGLEKLDDMTRQFRPADLAMMRAVKEAFDPAGLCNPGKVIPEGQWRLPDHEASKDRDPALPPSALANPASGWSVDGLGPRWVVRPRTEPELVDVIAWCRRDRLAAIAWGGGSQMGLGNRPARYDVAVDLSAWPWRLEHDADNLTLTVSASVPLHEVHAHLRRGRQRLGLEGPAGGRATVGGLVATAFAGARAAAYGQARDLILGLRAVLGSGVAVQPGGRTIKNVAGYDLCRLFPGSGGTLGIVTEVVFRLVPGAPVTKALVWPMPSLDEAAALVEQILRLPLEPVGVAFGQAAWVGALAAGALPWFVAAALEGPAAAVARLERELTAVGASAGRPRAIEADDYEPFLAALAGRAGTGGCTLRAQGLRTDVPWMVRQAVEAAARAGLGCTVCAHASTGRVWIDLEAAEAGAVPALVRDLRQAVAGRQGHLIVEAAAGLVKQNVDVWGEPPGGFDLMRRLKQVCDPDGVLSPGRYVGGL